MGLLAHVAQLAEHVLGKDEVTSSILVVGSIMSGCEVGFWSRSQRQNVKVASDPEAVLRIARLFAGVTQWLESRPSKPLVAGSNPVSRSSF